MKRLILPLFFCGAVLLIFYASNALTQNQTYDPNPPFKLDLLEPIKKSDVTGREELFYPPRNPYNVFIFYELGMHCVGFDMSYCCIIPPYSSIQAQAVRSGFDGNSPLLLSPKDQLKLFYFFDDNSYSEGNKMRYWHVAKDVGGTGTMSAPNDNLANYVWSHLFIYKDLSGTLPENPAVSKRHHLGKEIPIPIDSGPSGKSLFGGYLDYSGDKGGNVVFTDSLLPTLKNVPLKLTASYLWDALGLPLTAFNDSRRRGSIRTVTDFDFQPYQYATVQLRDARGRPLKRNGRTLEFFGTEPIDIANCTLCHSGSGVAAGLSRGGGLTLFDKEYAYWKSRYQDTSEFYARLASANINILELHDRRHKTDFLKDYHPEAATNRLGRVGPVYCADCHGDNISGGLQIPRPGAAGYTAVRSKPLTEAIHSVHARLARLPDRAGRPQNCQACHPTHWQDPRMNDPMSNPYRITDLRGNPRFSDRDVRTSGGGCYLRRDAHTNPFVSPPFFLNEIGKWVLNEVSLRDETGKKVEKMRGLYCTNCHNHLARELYLNDDLQDPVLQRGKTLRNKTIGEVIRNIAGGDNKKFKEFYADPTVWAKGEPLYTFYTDRQATPLARMIREKNGTTGVFPWNGKEGEILTYGAVSAGNDHWLSPAVPHCADCHLAPFVESEGGKYFPLDQPNKYSLFRYSKAHGSLACQSCHESPHGLYPVRYEGPVKTVDLTSRQQALQFSPDGKYTGPVTCVACHTVNSKGIPVQLGQTGYARDYWASVVLIHFMREGDQKLPLYDLIKKYPYEASRKCVLKGWR